MHVGPDEARTFIGVFCSRYRERRDRAVWFFPPAVSIEATAQAIGRRDDLRVGAQDIHWERQGAFTGAISGPLARQAGARAALVGHSERRHVFGETDAETAKKVLAALQADLLPVLCVGETLAERQAGRTLEVVTRQLAAGLGGLDRGALGRVTIAYEPVWAIGTGQNATAADAALVHGHIRRWLDGRQAAGSRVLYGGSVNLGNIAELLAPPEIEGVLVGGASLDAEKWAALVQTAVD